MKKALILVVMVVLVAFATIAKAEDMEERESYYLYNEYRFEFPSSTGGGFISLTFIASGKEMRLKGEKGLSNEIIAAVVGRWAEKDKDAGVDQYIITILTYPYTDPERPRNSLPSFVFTYELDKEMLAIIEGLMTFPQQAI